MSKRYGELADALDELALHYRLDGRGSLARDYQLAASALRKAEQIPPDPSHLDGVSRRTRDSIAEWRAFGAIEELTLLREENPYLSDLTEIASIGPKRAKQINEETGAETIEDIKELRDEERLEEISGIGSKTATTIRRSISQQ